MKSGSGFPVLLIFLLSRDEVGAAFFTSALLAMFSWCMSVKTGFFLNF